MGTYAPRVTGNQENGFYALIVRVDNDGEENVIHGWKGKHYKTREAGHKATEAYLAKMYGREAALAGGNSIAREHTAARELLESSYTGQTLHILKGFAEGYRIEKEKAA